MREVEDVLLQVEFRSSDCLGHLLSRALHSRFFQVSNDGVHVNGRATHSHVRSPPVIPLQEWRFVRIPHVWLAHFKIKPVPHVFGSPLRLLPPA